MSAKKKQSADVEVKTDELHADSEEDTAPGASLKQETVVLPSGVRLTGYSGEYVFEQIRNSNDFYESKVLEKWYLPRLKESAIVYDIGANIGNHTVFFGKYNPTATIFSFEPFPPNYQLLCRNIKQNSLNANVNAFNIALGAANGTAKMEVEKENNFGTASISEEGSVEVQIKCLDELELPVPDFVKIDVEGHEMDVLSGMRQTISLSHPVIWVETSGVEVRKVEEFLREYGYSPLDAFLESDGNVLFSAEPDSFAGFRIDLLESLLREAELRRTLYWDAKKMTSKYTYEQHKAEELKQELGSMTSKYTYEQHKAEELKQELGSMTSKYTFEQHKAEELKQELGSMTSKYTYEQKKAEELKQELGSMTSKYADEQKKAEELKQELGSMTSKYADEQKKAEDLKQENDALTESRNVYRERSVYFKKLSEKHASQFLYEQKKAKALNEKMHRYEISKPYRVWAAYQKEKAKQKHKLYSFAQKTYYRCSRYPKVLKCFSGLNKILRVFPDTSEVIFYGAPKKANEAKTVHKESETYHNEPIEKVVPKSPRELNVAMIVDEFSYNSFRYECNALPLEPSNWKQIFENNKIDLFFCESAWAGTDPDRRPWRGQIYASVNFPKENRTALLDILAYCKAHKIPTAFWNKEDPTHYEDRVHDFVKTALLFDHIFTSAGECVERYKRDYGHKSVHLLMFATQPRLFNPIERFDRSNAVVFAGSWYKQHPHRCEEMSAIFDNILNQGLELIIYNRQSENDDPNHVFPEKYQPYVRPRLRHDQLDAAYKGSKYALNINTVTDSPTMFARRVFELMSSNTLVLSNYSEGMQKLFDDKVVFVDGEKKIDLTDSKTKRAAALEEVLSHHTYQKRFEQILSDCGIQYYDEANDLTVIYRVGSEEEAHNCLQLFQNITWREKNAILLVAKECDGETIRNICVDYQSGNISVISEDYLERYGKALEIKTKYAVLADSTMSPDFPARAMLHWCYLPEGVGIADGGSYSIRERSDRLNIIFPKDSFSLTASEAAVYDI